jgi:nicotinate-nucleotide adenylyltransferase
MRIGLYGGTFDPVHHGHLLLARDAQEELGLDRVIWIPCHLSPHKLDQHPATGRHRLAMLKSAVKAYPGFEISSVELDRTGPSYAVETATSFRRLYPRAELFWLIGADQLPKLSTWERFAELRRILTFVVLARPGTPLRPRPGVRILKRNRLLEISASEIRARVEKGLPISGLTPEPVVRYIHRQHLYCS